MNLEETEELLDALRVLRIQIDNQLSECWQMARERSVYIHQLRDPNGNFMLTPLLVAKAQVVSAQAQLELAWPKE